MSEAEVKEPVQENGGNEGAGTGDPAPVENLDWRREFAGEDEKFYNHLSKYNTAKDVARTSFEFRQKLSSGEYKRNIPFPADGTPEDQMEWRKENGIPEAPDKYGMPDGIVFGEDDQPIINDFLETMHKSNVPEGAAKEAMRWYHKAQETAAARMAEEEKAQKVATEEALRSEFGAEYRSIINMTENFAKTRFGDIMGDALMNSSPEVVKALADIAREINPAATIVPNSANPLKGVKDQIEKYRAEMRNPEKWAKNIEGQRHMAQLLEAEAKMR